MATTDAITKTKDYTKYHTFIYKVLKQVHPDNSITADAKALMNDLVIDLIARLVQASNTAATTAETKTMTTAEIQKAVNELMTPKLASYAVAEGTKAVIAYSDQPAPEKAPEGAQPRKRTPRAARAGLQFPVTRVAHAIRDKMVTAHLSDTASIYFTAVVEFITAEILELAGNTARDNKRVTITPKFIQTAITADAELHALFPNVNA